MYMYTSSRNRPNCWTASMIVLVLRKINLLFFDDAHQVLGVAVLPGRADFGHADLDTVAVSKSVYSLVAYCTP